MQISSIAHALWSLLALLGIIYLLFWRYRIYRIDKFRDEMFALRDELFDEAASGLIDFNHPAYGMLRRTMNGFIRFSHRLTLWEVIFILILINRTGGYDEEVSFGKRWQKAIADFDEGTKARLISYRERMQALVVWHLFLAAPEFYPLLILVAAIGIIVWAMRSSGSSITSWLHRALDTSPVLRSGVDKVDSAALVYGKSTI